jgi:hypothetical protein
MGWAKKYESPALGQMGLSWGVVDEDLRKVLNRESARESVRRDVA